MGRVQQLLPVPVHVRLGRVESVRAELRAERRRERRRSERHDRNRRDSRQLRAVDQQPLRELWRRSSLQHNQHHDLRWTVHDGSSVRQFQESSSVNDIRCISVRLLRHTGHAHGLLPVARFLLDATHDLLSVGLDFWHQRIVQLWALPAHLLTGTCDVSAAERGVNEHRFVAAGLRPRIAE